ncbi:SDR family NAD(P)-dependent oxidoreductase [Candidatus Mesenet endosymbiont of Agriotes lineatus]|uniref:SDR family NAD(P)-dependent oxidoreductase n=1 Tax=Candidatus Mesenet endosymbiont of Agriotes lineatus TaxID=3077948 RepID=UPI0030D52094
MSDLLSGKVALITGASKGIGAAVAKRFIQEGAHVILVSRNIEDLREVDDEIKKLVPDKKEEFNTTLVQLDLLEFEKIKELAGAIDKQYQRLDILVASAGVLGELCPVQDYDPGTWESIIGTNFNANWYLIKNLDLLLKRAEAGRVIFVTSNTGQSPISYPYWSPYAASKAALEAMVKVYAAETKHTKLCINIVQPGTVNSGVYKQAFPGQDVSKLPSPEELTDKFVELASQNCKISGEVFQLQPT